MSDVWYSNTTGPEEYPTTGMEIKFGNSIEELKKQILELSYKVQILESANQELNNQVRSLSSFVSNNYDDLRELEHKVQDLEDYVEYDGEDEAIDEREDSNYRECNLAHTCRESVIWNRTPNRYIHGNTWIGPGQGIEASTYPEIAEGLLTHNLAWIESQELTVSAPSDSYKLQEQITKVFTPLVEAVFQKESTECDCGAEKHGFLSHITGCPAGSK